MFEIYVLSKLSIDIFDGVVGVIFILKNDLLYLMSMVGLYYDSIDKFEI